MITREFDAAEFQAFALVSEEQQDGARILLEKRESEAAKAKAKAKAAQTELFPE